MPVPKGVPKEKYDSCVEQVKEKQGSATNPWAVCAASLKRNEPDMGSSYRDMQKKEASACKACKATNCECKKARIDEGLSPQEKVKARVERKFLDPKKVPWSAIHQSPHPRGAGVQHLMSDKPVGPKPAAIPAPEAPKAPEIKKEGDGSGKTLGQVINKPVVKADLGAKQVQFDDANKQHAVDVEPTVSRPDKSIEMEDGKNAREKTVLETHGGHTPEFGIVKMDLEPGMSYTKLFQKMEGEPLKKPTTKKII